MQDHLMKVSSMAIKAFATGLVLLWGGVAWSAEVKS